MIAVIETKDGFEPIAGNPTLTSLDGEVRAPLAVIMHESWSAEERAKFGVFLAEPAHIPDGKIANGVPSYERVRGKVVEVKDLVDLPTPIDRTPREKLDQLLAFVGLSFDEFVGLLK